MNAFLIKLIERSAFLIFVFFLSCATASTGFATSNIPLEGKKITNKGETTIVESWYSFDIGIISFPFQSPPVAGALQTMMKEKEGNAVMNLRYATDMVRILFITRHRLKLTAEVVKVEEEDVKPKTKGR